MMKIYIVLYILGMPASAIQLNIQNPTIADLPACEDGANSALNQLLSQSPPPPPLTNKDITTAGVLADHEPAITFNPQAIDDLRNKKKNPT